LFKNFINIFVKLQATSPLIYSANSLQDFWLVL